MEIVRFTGRKFILFLLPRFLPLRFLFRLKTPPTCRGVEGGKRVSLIGPIRERPSQREKHVTRGGVSVHTYGRRRAGARVGDDSSRGGRRGVYLARFQNLHVLYLVPFHFRRRAATKRYLSERNFSKLISATARSDSPSPTLFSAEIVLVPVCFPASRLSDREGGMFPIRFSRFEDGRRPSTLKT